MPFDPTLPLNNSNLTATEFRNQLNALNDLITNLTARVAVLELPPVITASGYGYPEANGILTQSGIHDGKPWYTIAGGFLIWWQASSGTWVLSEEIEPHSGSAVWLYKLVADTPTPVGQYELAGEMNGGPAGAVAEAK